MTIKVCAVLFLSPSYKSVKSLTLTVYSKIYQFQKNALANATWDTILVHFVQMLTVD